jgi:RNA polymerase sigma-70 factor, ECF subfamily
MNRKPVPKNAAHGVFSAKLGPGGWILGAPGASGGAGSAPDAGKKAPGTFFESRRNFQKTPESFNGECSLAKKNLDPGGNSTDPVLLVHWIEAAKKGDIGAFQRIYDQFARKVLNFIYRMVASAEEAEDLTQETFVTVYQKLGSLKDDAKFEPWLFRIARNYVYQNYRRRAPATVSVDIQDEEGHAATELVDERKDPQEAFQAGELERVVHQVISELPEKYREVFILSAIHNLSYQEVADVVGRSLPSVKTDIHRARLQVRARVKDYLKAP